MEHNSGSKEISNEDLTLFQDALTTDGTDNMEMKVYTVKRIAPMAKALGPQRTREELLDVIASHVDKLDDEVLFFLAEELELFLPLVGGAEFSYELLSLLLKISRCVDETLVRNRAVESIKKLLTDIDQQLLIEKYLVTSIVEIDDNVWFSEKCSTLSLIPVCYPKASSENKILLRQKYSQIFEDSSALIRKLAAAGLADFIGVLEIEHVLKDCIPMLNQIVEDDQDSVSINAVEISLSIANKSKNREVRNDMMQIVSKLSKNKSWRIRQRVALLMEQVTQAFNDEEFVATLLEMYAQLTSDDEVEVRVYAVQNVHNFARELCGNICKIENPKQSFEDIFRDNYMPIIISITSDRSDAVQIALSSAILSLSTIISNECFKDVILPIVIHGLEEDKPLLYKENLLMNLDYLPNDVDLVQSLSSINKIIQHILITSETSWRTRRSLLITFVHVSKYCTQDFFKKNLLVYYVILLKDKIYAVRRTASMILPILAKNLGAKWLISDMIPHIHITAKDEKYLFRYIILFCAQELILPSTDKSNAETNEKIEFLGNLKELIGCDETKYKINLYRIYKLNAKLRDKLKEQIFENILRTYTDNNNISGENVSIYSEELLNTITKHNADVFSIKKNGTKDDITYLEGVLILLHATIVITLKTLIKDPIKNIQDRSKYVLTKIKEFSDALEDELQQTWVTDYTKRVDEVSWEEINAEIVEKIDDVEKYCASVEKIDTSLMKSLEHSCSRDVENVEIVEKLDVFPSDRLPNEAMQVDEMESVDEEKIRDSKN